MDYIFSARNKTKSGFGTDPGPTRFLVVPKGAKTLDPSQEIPRRKWFDAVVAEAEVSKNPASGRSVGDVLIHVHGFNNTQGEVLNRHRRLRTGLEALGYKGAVVSFDWPCGTSAISYLPDRIDAKETAFRLVADGIAPFARYIDPKCEISTHVLAHSMGAYVLRTAFDDAADRPAVEAVNWMVSQLMICSGDVSAASMGDTATSAAMYQHCQRLTNYSNPYDAVLSISNAKRAGVSPRVGRVGLPPDAPAKAVNVNVGQYYDAHREEFAGLTNADHSFYLFSKEFLQDVFLTLQGNIDRASIPTRIVEGGRLYLRP